MQPHPSFPQGYAYYSYPLHTTTLPPGPPHMVAENAIPPTSIVQLIHGAQPQVMTTFNSNTPLTMKRPLQRQMVHGEQEWVGSLRKFGGHIEEDAGQWLKEFEALATANKWDNTQ